MRSESQDETLPARAQKTSVQSSGAGRIFARLPSLLVRSRWPISGEQRPQMESRQKATKGAEDRTSRCDKLGHVLDGTAEPVSSYRRPIATRFVGRTGLRVSEYGLWMAVSSLHQALRRSVLQDQALYVLGEGSVNAVSEFLPFRILPAAPDVVGVVW